jgi:hypothetical protein
MAPGLFQVDMSHYVNKILDDFPEQINKSSTSPHGDKLFDIKEDATDEMLSEEQAMQFY